MFKHPSLSSSLFLPLLLLLLWTYSSPLLRGPKHLAPPLPSQRRIALSYCVCLFNSEMAIPIVIIVIIVIMILMMNFHVAAAI